jgi:hypothetical protein
MRPDLTAHLKAVDPREHDVQEDESVGVTQDHGDAFLPCPGRIDVDLELAQDVLEQEGVDPAVIYHQD